MQLRLLYTSITLALVWATLPMHTFSQNVRFTADTAQVSAAKPGFGQWLFAGVLLPVKPGQEQWYIPAATSWVQFNTVEGLVFTPSTSYTQTFKQGQFLNLKPAVRYGIGSRRLNAHLEALYLYNPEHFAYIKVSGGRRVQQINPVSSLDGFRNTINTLLFRRNFLKLYESSFANLTHVSAPFKDLLFTTSLHWEDRAPLKNLDKFDVPNSEYTPNAPQNDQLAHTTFVSHQVFLWRAQLTWQKDQAYARYRGKFVPTSPAPALSLSFTTSLSKALGNDISFQKLSLSLQDQYPLGAWGMGQLLIEMGGFLSKDSLSFLDFNHFNGNLSVFTSFELNGFQLLDYYQFSNADYYGQAHLQHNFHPISLGKKPLSLHPVFSAHYLYTKPVSYLEVGLGLNKLLKNWRLEGYGSFLNGRFDRIGIRFGFMM